ncbi:helix-turn-helix transcriptional regulator [Nonomuraea sp. B12E4]|uniref:helix-turn-helix domain-containing protein n=1 Tax=Nonomuraea sp. B12E4 TaxID=3153564 RepID=UPI00325D3267
MKGAQAGAPTRVTLTWTALGRSPEATGCDGLSSKEIAAQLFLGPRTVEYHLYKIYPKLGIGTRAELARLVVLLKAPVAAQGML